MTCVILSDSGGAGTKDEKEGLFETKESDMANKNLFAGLRDRLRWTDAINNELAPAYAHASEHALAQYAATGCLNSTFYARAELQLDALLRMAHDVSPAFLAQTAIHCRTKGHMKDAPAVLLAVLASRDGALMEQVFDRVIDTGRMLRTFVQIIRSGVTGRSSLGSRPRRCVRRWLAGRDATQLLRDSVGSDPSLADVIRMVRPAPDGPERSALYGWLVGQPHDADALPQIVRTYEAWKQATLAGCDAGPVPPVPFQMLTSMPLDRAAWTSIATNARWHMTRMNLNTFHRHGLFADDDAGRAMVLRVAKRLRDRKAIRKARVFPYQLLAAYLNANSELPRPLRDALHDAMEVALENVPAIAGRVVVCPDVSGSMTAPVSGWRKGSSSKVRCVDVAALVAAAVLRKNPEASVMPFEHRVVKVRLDPRDTVMTNASHLARVGGGGTALSAPLADLVRRRARVDAVIFVSDNESWFDAHQAAGRQVWQRDGTETMRLWEKIKRNNPSAKLVCIDLQPYGTTQARERDDILNVGGFSDTVFEMVADFLAGRMSPDHWVGNIRNVKLESAPV